MTCPMQVAKKAVAYSGNHILHRELELLEHISFLSHFIHILFILPLECPHILVPKLKYLPGNLKQPQKGMTKD